MNTKIDRMWLTELQSDWVWCGLWIVSSTEACVTGVWRTSWTGGVLEYPCNSSPHSMELQLRSLTTDHLTNNILISYIYWLCCVENHCEYHTLPSPVQSSPDNWFCFLSNLYLHNCPIHTDRETVGIVLTTLQPSWRNLKLSHRDILL